VVVIGPRRAGRPPRADFGSPAWVATLVAEWVVCLAISWAIVATLARVPGLAAIAGERPSAR
jgi:hypothetical protein